MGNPQETLEGYVVDIACLRKYPQDELFERAQVHTRSCAVMGHCAESGYGLVTEDGRVVLLEPAATPSVLHALSQSERDRGIKLRATREMREHEMQTTGIEEV